ncbi:chromosome condensation regulator RCC1 [soil metagenome]
MIHGLPRLAAMLGLGASLLVACAVTSVDPADHEDVGATREALSTTDRLIAVGSYHACAVLPNHTVSCWGDNTHGELGDGTTTSRNFPMTVPSLTSIVSITAGQHHTCSLDVFGQVKCWGYNAQGEIGDGSTINRLTPVLVPTLGPASAVDAGGTHTCALSSTGLVRCWGWNAYGQIGNNSTANALVPVQALGLTKVKSLSAGYAHTCAVDAQGATWCWGSNAYGESGSTSRVPALVAGIPEGVTVSAGMWHTCVTTTAGSGFAYCWGSNAQGQIGRGTTLIVSTPAIAGWPTRRVEAGEMHSCEIMSTGLFLCTGKNTDGRLGISSAAAGTTYFTTTGLTDVLDVSTGSGNTCIVRMGGIVACAGDNSHGQLGDSTYVGSTSFRPINSLASGRTQLAAGGGLVESVYNQTFFETGDACVKNAQNRIFCWGDNRTGQFGIGGDSAHRTPVETSFPNARSLKAGPNVNCVIDDDNRLSCAGDNLKGQLGRGFSSSEEKTFGLVNSGITVADVGISEDTMCFVRVDGSVWCAGKTDAMNPGVPSSLSPTQVPGVSDAVSIASGETGLCILHATGTVTCWGFPVDTSGITDAVEITAGESNVCILRSNGTLRCLGNDYAGQSGGTGDILSDVVKVDLGYLFGCALKTDGKIYCWGRNNNGELCRTLTGTTFSPVPAPINSTDRFVDVSAGGQVGCGVTTTGVVKCWGNTLYVGDGSPGPLAATSPHTVPLP